MSITVSALTAGSNNFQTTSEHVNAIGTDMLAAGVVGAVTNSAGVAPATGAFSVNANGTPNNTVIVGTGKAYALVTPSSQASQLVRINANSSTTVTISANTTGSTRYDWLYISLSAANAAVPASDGSNVATIVTSRSTSQTTDNGTPPTFGLLLAVVTVANSFTTITNGNIADKRVISSPTTVTGTPLTTSATSGGVNGATVASSVTGSAPTISATGTDANIFLALAGKGTGKVISSIGYLSATPATTAWGGGGTEVILATLTVPSQPVAIRVILFGNIGGVTLGSPAPTTNSDLRIRLTNISGTQVGIQRQTKVAAAGITEVRPYSLFTVYNLPANTSQVFVLTGGTDGGASVVAGLEGTFTAFIVGQ